MEIFGILGIIFSILAALSAFADARRAERKRREQAPTLENRIETMMQNLKLSSAAISEIEVEIRKRSEIVNKLKKDVHVYTQLRELNQSQVEAIAQTIRREIIGESRKSMWRSTIITFFIALAFFFLGWLLRGI